MLRILFAAALALAATDTVAADVTTPPPDPYASPIEQCIRDNAGKVEAAIADLNQGVDFLVGKVCAAPIAEHNQERVKLQQQQNALRMRSLCDDQATAQAAAKSDSAKPENGRFVVNGVDYCAVLKSASTSTAQPLPYDPWLPAPGIVSTNPPAAVALAAQLILDLRSAHKHHGK
jgi:hypothetical protein